MPEPEHGAEHLLTEKGPGKIPVWAYGVGIAGVIVVFQMMKGSKASQAAPQDTGQGSQGQGDATTVTTVTRSGGRGWRPPWKGWESPFPEVSAPSTNEQWEAIAADWLIGVQGGKPGTVHDALTDFLDGENQSGHKDAHERALVRLAINQFGNPPQAPGTPVGNPGWAPKSRGNPLGPGSPQGEVPIGSDAPPGMPGGASGVSPGSGKEVTNVHETVKIEDRGRRRRR